MRFPVIHAFKTFILCLTILSPISCGKRTPFKTVVLEKNGMLIRTEFVKVDANKKQVSGLLKVRNISRFKKKFAVPQLTLRNQNEQFRTYMDAVTAFMIDYSPVDLNPKDSLKLTVFWVMQLPRDTSGLFLEYTDILGAGRVHSTDKAITRPDSVNGIPGK